MNLRAASIVHPLDKITPGSALFERHRVGGAKQQPLGYFQRSNLIQFISKSGWIVGDHIGDSRIQQRCDEGRVVHRPGMDFYSVKTSTIDKLTRCHVALDHQEIDFELCWVADGRSHDVAYLEARL